MQKARLPSPTHPSHLKHRRQLWTRILIPMLLAVAVIIAIAVLTSIAAFQPEGEVGRWSAISTMWILIPLMVAGLILLLVMAALIYGMARLLNILPGYTVLVQNMFQRVEGFTKRMADGAVKPVLTVEGIRASIKRLVRMK